MILAPGSVKMAPNLWTMRRTLLIGTTLVLLAGCSAKTPDAGAAPPPTTPSGAASQAPPATAAGPAAQPRTWVYQLTGYDGGLDAVRSSPAEAAVIDLARDGSTGYWTAAEIGALAPKTVYSYFSIGSIENYRPEAAEVKGLELNQWGDWPDEHFVKYWDAAWWDRVVRPRVDQAIASGFTGAYLDVPNAYEEIDLSLVPGETRESLGRKMTELIVEISEYAKGKKPGFRILPQNSPELRAYPGYVDAVDGLGIEELFYLATDEKCAEDFCAENLDHVRALKAAGKIILAVDYADDAANRADACAKTRAEGFAGYVGAVGLDGVKPVC